MSRPGIGAAVERIKQFAHDCVGVVMAPLGMVEGCQKREEKNRARKERASKTGFFKDAGDDYVLLDGAEPPVVLSALHAGDSFNVHRATRRS